MRPEAETPDDHILAGGAAAGDVALSQFLGVLVDFDGRGQSLGSAGHDVLHLARSGGVGGRTLGGVERGDASAGAGADVDQPAAVAEAARHLVDDLSDLRNRLLHRRGNLRVFVVDDPRDLQRRLGVEALGRLVLAFRRQLLEEGGLVVIGSFRLCAFALLHRHAAQHRI